VTGPAVPATSDHGDGCSCVRCRGFESGNGAALRHGCYSRAAGEDETLANLKLLLGELAERGWFTIEKRGRHWRIQRGPKALALAAGSPK
jgi:hypothetical protein